MSTTMSSIDPEKLAESPQESRDGTFTGGAWLAFCPTKRCLASSRGMTIGESRSARRFPIGLTVDSVDSAETRLRPHHRGPHGGQHLLAFEIVGLRSVIGDHRPTLLFARPLVDVEKLVEEIRCHVLGLLVDGAGVLGRTETAIGNIRRADLLVELVTDGPAEALEQSESS